MKIHHLIFSIFLISIPDMSYAGDLSRKLSTDASFAEVLSLWGEPMEKVEKSFKSEIIWYYAHQAHVVFKDGKVKTWRQIDSLVKAEQNKQSDKFKVNQAMDTLDAGMQNLIHDIIKEVPSAPDAPYVGEPELKPQKGPPPLIPNQFPPGGKGAPPGVVPGGDVYIVTEY